MVWVKENWSGDSYKLPTAGKKKGDACGQCSFCHRILEKKNELIYEINLEEKKNISVDQIREVRYFVSLQALNPFRFVIIDPSDRLSRPASNALLKILEEPPAGTHFFLLTDRPGSLLATIRSRCQKFLFHPLNRDELLQIENFGEEALSWSCGSVEQAFFLEDPENKTQLGQSLEFLRSLLSPEPAEWKKHFPWFFSKENGSQREFCFKIWNRAFQKKLYSQDCQKDDLDWLPGDPEVITSFFDSLHSFQENLWANVDKLLALESFYYSVQRTLSK